MSYKELLDDKIALRRQTGLVYFGVYIDMLKIDFNKPHNEIVEQICKEAYELLDQYDRGLTRELTPEELDA
jgi:hypothetical protein